MRDKPYPLSAALSARAQTKEEARACLERERAQRVSRARDLEQVQLAMSALTHARRARAEQRAHSGAELHRFGAEASRHAIDHACLVQKEGNAKLALAAQERRLRAAEQVLASSFAEHAVLERHHAQFRQDVRRDVQNQTADEQDDVLATRARERAQR